MVTCSALLVLLRSFVMCSSNSARSSVVNALHITQPYTSLERPERYDIASSPTLLANSVSPYKIHKERKLMYAKLLISNSIV